MNDETIGTVGTPLTLDHIRRALAPRTPPLHDIPVVLTDDEFEATASMYSIRGAAAIDDFLIPGWHFYRMRPRNTTRIEREGE